MTEKNAAAVDIPVTPRDTKSQIVDVRSKSTTSISGVQISKPKPIPNYLRPSIGSCHDHCKYGARIDISRTQTEIPRRSAKAKQSENLGRQRKTTKCTIQLETKNTEKKVPTRTNSAASSTKPTSRLSRPKTSGSTKKQNLKLKPSNPQTPSAEVPRDKKITEYDNIPEKTLYMVEDGRQTDDNIDKNTDSMRTKKRDPQESNGCTVHKVRQAKTLGQTQNKKVEYGKKSFRKVVSDGSSISTDDSTSSSSHRVVLRPHAIEKPDTYPRLYNRVIKETASKLIRTRKSRVKALVGAFEAVINLQDNKTSRTITTL